MVENNEKQFRAGKFQGRVEEALLDIRNDIKELKADFKKDLEGVEKEVKCVKEKVTGNRARIAYIAGFSAFIVTVLMLLANQLFSVFK